MQDAHAQVQLVQRALAALQAGDPIVALRCVDRACRVGVPGAEHLLLKAALLDGLGEPVAAGHAIEDAFRFDPLNPEIAARLLSSRARSLTDAVINAMARDMARFAGDLAYAEQLAPFLARDDRRAIGRLVKAGGTCRVEVLCDAPAPITLSLSFDGDERMDTCLPVHRTIRSDWFPFSVHLSCAWPAGARSCSVSSDTPVFWLSDTAAADLRSAPDPGQAAAAARFSQPMEDPRSVTIIMPVFRDAGATARCLRSLVSDRVSSTPWRLLVVNDGSDDPDMPALLASLAGDGRIGVIHNRRSMGFTGAVNAALRLTAPGPVILLNSDTVVPPGWLDRLRAAAHGRPQVGTVTPLSNNGEFTCFPRLGTATALLGDADLMARDRLAAQINAGRTVEIPSGVGFCLFITEACRRAVGLLDPAFGRGYLEDVDFSLRAAALGFRNLCAADVYVGHAGSLSFGEEKRYLVARHRQALARRHPRHAGDCARFMAVDPLGQVRQDLQRASLANDSRPVRLILSGARAVDDWALQEALRHIEPGEERSILLLCGGIDDGILLLHALDGDCPDRLSIEHTGPLDDAALRALMPEAPIRSVVMLDQSRPLDALMATFDASGPPLDLVISDASMICQCSMDGDAPLASRLHRVGDHRCETCGADDARLRVIALARRVIAPWAADPATGIVPASRAQRPARLTRSPRMSLAIRTVARGVSHVERLRVALADLRASHADWQWIILGTTADDDRLMRSGAGHVTGPMAASETLDIARHLGCQALFLDLPDAGFADPHWRLVPASPMPIGTFATPAARGLAARHPLHLASEAGPAAALAPAIAGFLQACSTEAA